MQRLPKSLNHLGSDLLLIKTNMTKWAKTQQAQPVVFKHLEKHSLLSSWEMGELSGSHDSAKKSPMVSLSYNKVGGVFPRSDKGLDVAVACGSSSGDTPSSGAEMGQVVLAATAVNSPIVGCPITGAEVSLLVSSSDGHSYFIDPDASSKVGSLMTNQFLSSPICFAINNCWDKTNSLLIMSWFLIQMKMTL